MKRTLLAAGLAGSLLMAMAVPASATIHPIVASFCAAVAETNPNVLDPPGQTPSSFNPNTWDQSDLRALLATGVLTLIRDASGNVIGFTVDLTHPSVKNSDFPAFGECTSLQP